MVVAIWAAPGQIIDDGFSVVYLRDYMVNVVNKASYQRST